MKKEEEEKLTIGEVEEFRKPAVKKALLKMGIGDIQYVEDCFDGIDLEELEKKIRETGAKKPTIDKIINFVRSYAIPKEKMSYKDTLKVDINPKNKLKNTEELHEKGMEMDIEI